MIRCSCGSYNVDVTVIVARNRKALLVICIDCGQRFEKQGLME